MKKEELKRGKKLTALLLSAALCIGSLSSSYGIMAKPLSDNATVSSDETQSLSGSGISEDKTESQSSKNREDATAAVSEEKALHAGEEAAEGQESLISPSINFIYMSENKIYYEGDLDDSRDFGSVFFDDGTFSWESASINGFELADELETDDDDDETGSDRAVNVERNDVKYVYGNIDGEKIPVGEISVNYVSKNSIDLLKKLDGLSENAWREKYGDAAGYTLKPGSYYAKSFFIPYERNVLSDNGDEVKESYFASASSNIIEFEIKKAPVSISPVTDEYVVSKGSISISENIEVKNLVTGIDITSTFVSSCMTDGTGILLVNDENKGNSCSFNKAGDYTIAISEDSVECDPEKEYGTCYTTLLSENAVYGDAITIIVPDGSKPVLTAVIDEDTVVRYGVSGDLLSEVLDLYVTENGESIYLNDDYSELYDGDEEENSYASLVLPYSSSSVSEGDIIKDVSTVSAGQTIYLRGYAIDTYNLYNLYEDKKSVSYDYLDKTDIYGKNKDAVSVHLLSSNIVSVRVEKRLINLTVSDDKISVQRGGQLPSYVSLDDIDVEEVVEDWEYDNDSKLNIRDFVSGNLLSDNGIRLVTDAIDTNIPGIYGSDTDHPAAGLDITNEKNTDPDHNIVDYEAYLTNSNYRINKAEAYIRVEPAYYVHYILKYQGTGGAGSSDDDTVQLEVCYSGDEIQKIQKGDKNIYHYDVYAPVSVSSDGSDFGVSFPEGTCISGWNVFDGDHEKIGSYDYDEVIEAENSDLYMYAIVSAKVSDGIRVESVSPVIYTGRKHVISDEGSKKNTLTNDIELNLTDIATGRQLKYGTNYTVSYRNNLNASIAYDGSVSEGSLYQLQDKLSKRPSMTIRGKGNYRNLSCTLYFDIYPASFDKTAYYNTDLENPNDIDNAQIMFDNYDTWMEDKDDIITYYYFLGRNKINVKDRLVVSALKKGSSDEYADKTLRKGKDYYEYAQIYDGNGWEDCEITDLDDEGYYRVIACGMGNYTGQIIQDFVISDGFAAQKLTADYNKRIDYKENITVKDFDIHLYDPWTGEEMTYDKDYYLSRIEKYDPDDKDYHTYAESDTVFGDAGKYRLYLQPTEDYIYAENSEGIANNVFGQKVLDVSVKGKNLTKNMFTLDWKKKDYTGSSDLQTVKALSKAPSSDCYAIEIESADNSAPGKYHAYVYGVGEYASGKRIDLTYTRKGMSLANAVKKGMVTISLNDTYVNLSGVVPEDGTITVENASGSKKTYGLNEDSDYCFAVKKASGNKKIGTGKAVIYDASGVFSGSVKADFNILPKSIIEIKDIDDPESYSYDLLSNRYVKTYDPDILYSKIKDVKKGNRVKVELYQADRESNEKLKKLSAKEFHFEEKNTESGFDNYVIIKDLGQDFTIQNVTAASKYNIYTKKIKSSEIDIALDSEEFTFTGDFIYPKLKSVNVSGESYGISDNGLCASKDNTFEVSYINNAAVGNGSVVVTIVGDKDAKTPVYGEKAVKFKIKPQTNEGLIMSVSGEETQEDDIDEFLNVAEDDDWTPEYSGQIDTSLPPTDNAADSDLASDDSSIMATLPSYYKSSNVTSVKNQGSFGWCWSFSSIAAIESSLLSTGRSLKSKNDLDLSEQQITYWRMHEIAERVGMVSEDRSDKRYINGNMKDSDQKAAELERKKLLNSINSARSSKGLKKLTLDSIKLVNNQSIIDKGYAFKGGNTSDVNFVGTNLGGIADESVYDNAPYKAVNTQEYKNWDNHEMPTGGNYRIKQWICIPMSGRHDTVKNLIKAYGGVTGSYFSNWQGYNNDYSGSYYLPSNIYNKLRGNTTCNHAIEIIGWDDNYPASKFRTNPGCNGAWIVKNSWGTNSRSLDKNGYIYISYADPSLERNNISTWIMTNSTRQDYYQNIYSRTFDRMNYVNAAYPQYCTKYTNETKEQELIMAVGTYLNTNGIVRVKIYKDDAGSNIPTNGTLVYNGLHMSSYAGYAAFDLREKNYVNGGPYINKGDSYYVVISGSNGTKLKVPRISSGDRRLYNGFSSSKASLSVYWLGEYRQNAKSVEHTSLVRSVDDKCWEYCYSNGKPYDVGIIVYTNKESYAGGGVTELPKKEVTPKQTVNIKAVKKSYNCLVGQTIDIKSKLNLTRPITFTKSSNKNVAFYSDKKRIYVKGKGTATIDIYSTINGQKVMVASVTINCKYNPRVTNVNAKKGAEFSIYKFINMDGLSNVAFSNISKTVKVRLKNGKIVNKYPVYLIKKNGSTYIKASYKGTGYIQCRFANGVSRTMKITVK